MSFKDKFNKFIEYFTEDGEKSDLPVQPLDEPDSVLKRLSQFRLHQQRKTHVLVQLLHKSNKSLQRKILLDCMLANKNWLSIE